MKSFITSFLCLIASLCIAQNTSTTAIQTKRKPPQPVAPVITKNIEYSCHLNTIIATDLKKNMVLWKKEIYPIAYKPSLEKDVQDVYINSLIALSNVLLIKNEKGNFYRLNTTTKKVSTYSSIVKTIHLDSFGLIISDASQEEFENSSSSDNAIATKGACLANKDLIMVTKTEFDLKLIDGSYFKLKQKEYDEQFNGYRFIHLDKNLNIYVLWEEWYEAGHPILVNQTNGSVTTIFGPTFVTHPNKKVTANYAADIGAGWATNGIQLLTIKNEAWVPFINFDPVELLDEHWGVTNVTWISSNSLIAECVAHNGKGDYITSYKRVEYYPLNH